jgi:probable O-glycosylation ligase (exosortase A-associated)
VRDIVVFTLFVVLLPACLMRPWVGLMVFSWLAYNRTQDLTWGFARGLPISELVAIAMIVGWIFWEYRPLIGRDPRLRAMVALVIVIGISIATKTIRFDAQFNRYTELIKVIFVALLTNALLVSRTRLRAFALVLALALGFYGVKNALFYLAGGGTINGPGGMLKDNNDFALAMVMNVGFLWYLPGVVGDMRFGRFLRYFLRAAFFLNVLTIMSTSSRGGFLAMGVVLFMMAMKTRFKVPALVSVALLGLLAFALAPPEYIERLRSITEAKDASVQGRLVSWRVAGNMIKRNPLLGIGFNNMVFEYQRYTQGVPIPEGSKEIMSRVAHNSYLQIWAESGTIAFGLFLFMIFSTIFLLRRIQRLAKDTPDDWVLPYARAIEVTFYGYLTGAMFLNRAHFDLVYQLVAVAAALPVVVVAERERQKALAARRRKGPALAQHVWVRHKDPFVKLPSG